MISYTRCKVLLPERILKMKATSTEKNFLFLVQNYLTWYPNYKFIREENGFAICDREDEVKGKKK
ncbi:hypothetical protein [Bacillus sp. ISL-46]|uniref:hypothetical protein n=1 Tax=Bacillus sp. ISL-46 TaxID=2819129 RepID=UPI001BE65479|nr:hypothetical protein [Bacillus sp. ISL-46]MBT2722281.1 hypothetical protein [Bacillus sp. ISL-46]